MAKLSTYLSRPPRPVVFLLCLVPAALIGLDALRGRLGADPIRAIQLRTGWWALAFLLIALAVTPVRRVTRWNGIGTYRRMVGLFAFTYAALHFLNYVVLDQFFAWRFIVEDVAKRRWITVGFTSFLLLIPLAVTSTSGWTRRLGKRWVKLHRLAYVAAAGGVLHFLWLVKKDVREPALFGLVLVALLALRLGRRPRRTSAGTAKAAASREVAGAIS
jgi:methionine sulfoxide reductase heme-binding subunit